MENFLTRPLLTPPSPADGKRVVFLDLVKGLGIIFVAWLHSGIVPHYIIDRFIMMMFFVISGIFFKPWDTPGVFLRKKMHELVLPFAFFALLSLLIEWAVYDMEHWSRQVWYAWTPARLYNTPLWFLPVLTWTTVVAYVVERYVKQRWLRLSIYAALLFAGLQSLQSRTFLPAYLSHPMVCLPMFLVGFKARDYIKKGGFTSPAMLILACAGIVWGQLSHTQTNVHRMIYFPHYFTSFAVGMSWIVAVFTLMVGASRTRLFGWLSYLGRNTLMILGLHYLIMAPLSDIWLPRIGIVADNGAFRLSQLRGLIPAIAVCFLCAWVGTYLKRLLPAIFGKTSKT